MSKPTVELRVGGPVIVKWPSDDPEIVKIAPYDEFIGVWTSVKSGERTARAKFMVLQDFDPITYPGELVGETDMPWFGRCRVFRLTEH